MKKIIGGLIGLTLLLPNLAGAVTIAELQAQINSLLAMVAQLQTQLANQQTTGSSGGSFCHTFNTDLKIGDRGSGVGYLHIALEKEGFSIPDGEGPQKDGETINDSWFGEVTASKVSAFQEKYRSEILTPAGLSNGTGYLGARTRAKLNALYGCDKPVVTPNPPVACTMEAMLCPDGSYVGRTGPKCEFSTCPNTTNVFKIISPNGGERWETGNTYTISWIGTSTNSDYYVGRVALYKGNDFMIDLVPFMKRTLLSGSVQYKVPSTNVLGHDFRIQAILYRGNSEIIKDWSDGYFSIISPTTD